MISHKNESKFAFHFGMLEALERRADDYDEQESSRDIAQTVHCNRVLWHQEHVFSKFSRFLTLNFFTPPQKNSSEELISKFLIK